jgi:hypothetical protein
MQLYVDTLPSTVSSFGAMNSFNTLNNSNGITNINAMNFNKPNDRSENKSPIFSKLRKDSTNEGATGNTGSFNPSRTFGG